MYSRLPMSSARNIMFVTFYDEDIFMQLADSNRFAVLQQKTYVEFFAGIGLVHAGLEKQGWSIALANDFDSSKYQMYRGNFTDASHYFILDDIFKLNVNDIPSTTLATACFPCKDLSLAGSLNGFYGKHSSAIWGFTRILEQMQQRKPPIIMLENVVGLLRIQQGEAFKLILQELNDLGYVVDAFIVDAAQFVPQSRERMFVVGLRNDIFTTCRREINFFGLESKIRPKALASFIINHPEIKWHIHHLSSPPDCSPALETIIENIPDNDPLWWSAERASYLLQQMSPRHKEIANRMIHTPRWSYGTVFRRMRQGKSTAELRTDGLAGCLRTPAGGSAKQILFKAGYGQYFVRLVTPREAARLMGANNYRIVVPSDQALFGFGDAVCVPVVEWIAEHYLNTVIDEYICQYSSSRICSSIDQTRDGENMDTNEAIHVKLERLYEEWYAGIDKEDGKSGWGAICGGITIVENLLKDYTLDITLHRTKGGTQLRSQGLALGNKVLRKFNANQRLMTGEFGRTSRGAPRAAERLLALLMSLHLETLSQEKRNEYLNYLEGLMVQALLLLMEREQQEIDFAQSLSTEKAIEMLLENASGASSGAIAQHLVGAKLELRFPSIVITNEPASAADEPTHRSGDFHVGDTVIHVTMAPQDAVFAKCQANLRQGLRVYLLVASKRLTLATTKAQKYGIADAIVVKSIESFVAQNLDEMAAFSSEGLIKQREVLLQVYNRRVKESHERYAPLLILKDNHLVSVEEVELQ